MTVIGLIAFVSYIVNIYGRWARITARRYGLWALLDPSYRPRRRGMGTGIRANPFGRAHGNLTGGTAVRDVLYRLERERAEVRRRVEDTLVLALAA